MIPHKAFELPPPNPGILLLLDLPPDASAAEVSAAWEKRVRSQAAKYFNTPPAALVKQLAEAQMEATGGEWCVAWASVKTHFPAVFRWLEGKKTAGSPWLGSDLAEKLTPQK